MGQTIVIHVTFFSNVACQKLVKLARVSLSRLKNKSGFVFLRHGVSLRSRAETATGTSGGEATFGSNKSVACDTPAVQQAQGVASTVGHV